MAIWSAEIEQIEKLLESLKGNIPELEKELGQLLKSDDPNVLMLYSRRCLEVIITDLCERELKRSRKTDPLKGIIDKLNKEEKVPSHIITSMHGLNDLSTYGAHPKDFDPEQVKPALSNLAIIIKWYLKYKGLQIPDKSEFEQGKSEAKLTEVSADVSHRPKKKLVIFLSGLFLLILAVVVLDIFNVIDLGIKSKEIAKLEKSVAILPFKNDSPDEENTYFINGIMEEILTNLQTIKDLRVISRTSCEKYRDQAKSIPEIAKELGVNYIVEGSGQKFGNTFRLRTQLIKAERESHLWAKSFEQEIKNVKDIFRIQNEIAQSIASELEAVIMPREKQLIEKIPTDNLEAYEAYLKGQFYLYKTNYPNYNLLDSALKYFEKAKDIDPEYAQAYAGICDVWATKQQGLVVSADEGNAKSMAAVMKAIELDSTISEVQYSLAHKKTWGLWDWEGAESAFKKSILLNPNNALAHAVYSNLLNIIGRPEEAMEHIELAIKLDPMNPFILLFYGLDLDFIRKFDEEIKVYKDIVKIEPGSSIEMAQRIGWTLFTSRHYNEAFEQFKIGWSNDPELLKAIEQGYTEDGWKGFLISYNEVCLKRDSWSPIDIAGNYALLGENDKAMYWYERAYENHDPNLPYVPLSPLSDILREDPRFQDLCRRMKLPYK
jgi:TolB-like protein/Tfp pilus assembly protein PilF